MGNYFCYCKPIKKDTKEDTIKILTGKKSLINQKIEEEVIDKGDIIITSDTNEIVFVNKEGVPCIIKAETPDYIFSSMEEALVYIDSNIEFLYEGKIFLIYDEESQDYKTYILKRGSAEVEDPEVQIDEEPSEPDTPSEPEPPHFTLKEYDEEFKLLAYDAIDKRHIHENKEILDTFTKKESEILQEIVNSEESILNKTKEYIESRLSQLIH